MEKKPVIVMEGEELENALKEIRVDKKLLGDLEAKLKAEVNSYKLWPIFKEARYPQEKYGEYIMGEITSLTRNRFERGYPLGSQERTMYEFLRTAFRLEHEEAIKVLKISLKSVITVAVEDGSFEVKGKEYKLPNSGQYVFNEEKRRFYRLTELD